MIFQLVKNIVPILLLVFGGMFGYMIIEGWSWFDALYMTIISITTVGYGEVHPLTEAGKIFTIFVILTGISNLAFLVRNLSLEFLTPFFGTVIRKKKLEKIIKNMKEHYIICGYGRIGRDVAFNLVAAGKQVVVVDVKQTNEEFPSENIMFIEGNASHDEVLQQAGIDHALGLVACVKSEAENVFITLTARDLNADILIIARFEETPTRKKLMRAGANKVINPYHIGGEKITQIILKPAITKILDEAYKKGDFNLNIEELDIVGNSSLIGRSIKDSGIREMFSLIILAIRTSGGEVMTSPSLDYLFQSGDMMVVIANQTELKSLFEQYNRT